MISYGFSLKELRISSLILCQIKNKIITSKMMSNNTIIYKKNNKVMRNNIKTLDVRMKYSFNEIIFIKV